MSYSIEMTRQANADLRDIFEHIAMELYSFESAKKLLAKLESKIFSLEQMPEQYHRYQHEPWLSRGMRVMVCLQILCVLHLKFSAEDRQHHSCASWRQGY